jgi:hypothetical protein
VARSDPRRFQVVEAPAAPAAELGAAPAAPAVPVALGVDADESAWTLVSVNMPSAPFAMQPVSVISRAADGDCALGVCVVGDAVEGGVDGF